MSFEHNLKISPDRIGVLVGKGGKVKNEIETKCLLEVNVDSKTGEVKIQSKGDPMETEPFKAVNIVTAIGRGFSAVRAFRLMDDKVLLDLLDLREYVGKSPNAIKRTKGRIIGMEGKSRRLIEQLSGAYISIYGHTVAIIGDVDEAKLALRAVRELASGMSHKAAYNMLQKAKRKEKLERMKLWEDEAIEQ